MSLPHPSPLPLERERENTELGDPLAFCGDDGFLERVGGYARPVNSRLTFQRRVAASRS